MGIEKRGYGDEEEFDGHDRMGSTNEEMQDIDENDTIFYDAQEDFQQEEQAPKANDISEKDQMRYLY